MARREPTKLGGCVKYNIGSFLAVFVLGWLALQQQVLSCDEEVQFKPKPPKPKPVKSLRKAQSQGQDSDPAEVEKSPEAEDTEKEVEKVPEEAPPEASAPTGKAQWVFCAAQWQDCTCQGNVRWGNKEKWLIIKPKKAGELQTVKCSVQVLEDVLPGDDGKHCDCEVIPGSSFHRGLNPMWLEDQEAEEMGAPLVASCDLWREDSESPWGQKQWMATEAFCSEDWDGEEAGERKMSLSTMQKLMEARVDPHFREAYRKNFAESGAMKGWTKRAFLNYFAGPPAGKHAKMTEELIRSVHMFSEELIIVVNFGMTSSVKLTPKRFPRLILLHGRPMHTDLKRSFNFNKLRAFLFSRALAGVGLDSDQFVAPGVDRLFEMTEREITEKYPLPIMPVHFLDRGPKDLGIWWSRYCPNDVCSLQTLRWGHAHPTWTYWALPFIGRWLRRNFRDETLPKVTSGKVKAPALRVVEIPEDEDLLNVGLWEEKATKQWCKFDITDPLEFHFLFEWKTKYGNRCSMGGHGCANISPDRRFYKHGAAKLFYTAHHAVEPADTHKQVDRISKKLKEGSWPNSTIVFQQKLWTAEDLRKDHPQLECLV